jgi:hypothetical protein
MRIVKLCLALVMLSAMAGAQAASAPPNPDDVDSKIPADLQEVVTRQFGPCFKIVPERRITVHYLHPPKEQQWVAFLQEDLNDDGVPDAVVVARCKDVMADQDAFDYKVSDPMFDYHGYGNPKVTGAFGNDNPEYGNVLLIIHGDGPEGWRAEKPQGKFVIINLEFDTLYPTKVNIGKKKKPKLTGAVHVEDKDGNGSVLFFDGKKYRWRETSGGSGKD